MEIVIKIPEGMVKALEQGCFGAKYNIYDLCGCIMNGTPLPKGHGALKDADEVMNVMERNFDMQDLYLPIHFKQFALDEAQTIVPADKEVDE